MPCDCKLGFLKFVLSFKGKDEQMLVLSPHSHSSFADAFAPSGDLGCQGGCQGHADPGYLCSSPGSALGTACFQQVPVSHCPTAGLSDGSGELMVKGCSALSRPACLAAALPHLFRPLHRPRPYASVSLNTAFQLCHQVGLQSLAVSATGPYSNSYNIF